MTGYSSREVEAFRKPLLDELDRLRAAIRKHRDQRGDDRCWLDDRELYAVLGDANDGDQRLPPPEEMLECCKRYIAHRHDPSLPYVSPQRDVERIDWLAKHRHSWGDDGIMTWKIGHGAIGGKSFRDAIDGAMKHLKGDTLPDSRLIVEIP